MTNGASFLQKTTFCWASAWTDRPICTISTASTRAASPPFTASWRVIELLQKHGAEYNILTTVHAANEGQGERVYKFLRDEVGSKFMQFIPIVERDNDTGYQEGDQVTDRSISAAGYGQFLIDMYEEWVRRDVGRVYVQIFDIALAAWTGAPPGLCIFDETCGLAMAMEHNGDVYSCDHYVEPDYKLGNIMDIPLNEIVVMEEQRDFGLAKRETSAAVLP